MVTDIHAAWNHHVEALNGRIALAVPHIPIRPETKAGTPLDHIGSKESAQVISRAPLSSCTV